MPRDPHEKPPPLFMPPPHGAEVTADYALVAMPPAHLPRFRVVHPPADGLTAAQRHAERLATEDYYRALGVALVLAQDAATAMGFHRTCARKACRRKKRCAGRRHEFDWSFPGPFMPPCAARLGEIEAVRSGMRAIAAAILAQGKADAAATGGKATDGGESGAEATLP